jgi:hypothetical protein
MLRYSDEFGMLNEQYTNDLLSGKRFSHLVNIITDMMRCAIETIKMKCHFAGAAFHTVQ